jgi:hypothetical protein
MYPKCILNVSRRDDERIALERQEAIEGSAVLEASGVERDYSMQSPTTVTSDLANYRVQLPWMSLGLLECLAIHFQSYVPAPSRCSMIRLMECSDSRSMISRRH